MGLAGVLALAFLDRTPPVLTFTFPEIRAAIYWHLSARKTISIMFARNATDAVKLAGRIRRVATSFGATTEEVRALVKQLGNAVWTNYDYSGPTPKQNALIKRCLH